MKEVKILKRKGMPDVVKVNGGGRKPEAPNTAPPAPTKPRLEKPKVIKIKPLRISPKFRALLK